jgi:hypothetical protein
VLLLECAILVGSRAVAGNAAGVLPTFYDEMYSGRHLRSSSAWSIFTAIARDPGKYIQMLHLEKVVTIDCEEKKKSSETILSVFKLTNFRLCT